MKEYIAVVKSNGENNWIEPVKELIRCKDCKHHYYHELLKQDYCDITNMQFGEVELYGYCHRAKRKEE